MAVQRRFRWSPPGQPRRGFTIIELVLAIAVIFVLMGLLLVGIRFITGKSKETIDRAAVTALKQSVAHFKDEFKFFPPLVKDGYNPGEPATAPLNANRSAPLVYSFSDLSPNGDVYKLKQAAAFVKAIDANPPQQPSADTRFSVYSLPIYLMGVLDIHRPAPQNNIAIDGVDGPRFKTVKRDGSFETAGKDYSPLYDPRNGKAVFETQPGTGRFELRDSHGVAYRYYRWIRGDANNQINSAEDCNIPDIVADPDQDQDAKGAEFAIVGAGPNGVFGDEALLPMGHPQKLDWQTLGSKVGVTCSNSPTISEMAKVIHAAIADNIVEYGR